MLLQAYRAVKSVEDQADLLQFLKNHVCDTLDMTNRDIHLTLRNLNLAQAIRQWQVSARRSPRALRQSIQPTSVAAPPRAAEKPDTNESTLQDVLGAFVIGDHVCGGCLAPRHTPTDCPKLWTLFDKVLTPLLPEAQTQAIRADALRRVKLAYNEARRLEFNNWADVVREGHKIMSNNAESRVRHILNVIREGPTSRFSMQYERLVAPYVNRPRYAPRADKRPREDGEWGL